MTNNKLRTLRNHLITKLLRVLLHIQKPFKEKNLSKYIFVELLQKIFFSAELAWQCPRNLHTNPISIELSKKLLKEDLWVLKSLLILILQFATFSNPISWRKLFRKTFPDVHIVDEIGQEMVWRYHLHEPKQRIWWHWRD